jgi:3-hydroxyacyl-CoA dehydrogenase/enoyl-CoA hydratase/carnithine racemase
MNLFFNREFSQLVPPPTIQSKHGVTSPPQQDLHNPTLLDLCSLIESSHKPILAALTGITFGGGFELALCEWLLIFLQTMHTVDTRLVPHLLIKNIYALTLKLIILFSSYKACHFRIASDNVQMALPEVKIGLIPGAGGTQRLSRLVKNLSWVLDFITTGKTVDAKEARRVGILDDICILSSHDRNNTGVGDLNHNPLIQLTQKWALFAETMGDLTYRTVSKIRVIPEKDTHALAQARLECSQMEKKLPSPKRGGSAAHGAIQAIRASFEEATFEAGMYKEGSIFFHLLQHSLQGRALRHAFFAERSCRKINANDAGPMALQGEVAQQLLHPLKGYGAFIGVIGAGLMGSGIAICFLRAGYHVVLVDSHAQSLKNGLIQIEKAIQGDVDKKRMTANQAAELLKDKLHPYEDLASSQLKQCMLVVEAIFENLALKQGIFEKLDQIVTHPSALLLTNTSTLNIDEVVKKVRPERKPYCAGMHFFSPAHVMKLVEIVQSSDSSPQTLLIIQAITNKNLQKIGVTVGNCDGFVGNRMIQPYVTEAVLLLQEGAASVSDIDNALVDFGMALGPLQMADLSGNDIGYLIRKEKGLVDDPTTGRPGPHRTRGMRYSSLADDLVTKLGRLGQKKMKGWYDYDLHVGGGRKPIPSKEVSSFIAKHIKGSAHKLSSDQIIERIMFPLVNEGFKILQDAIAKSPDDIDIIYLYGYGFPSWKGGPMFWADNEIGLKYLLKRLEEFNSSFPGSDYFIPSTLLRKCVDMNITVKDFFIKGYHKLGSSRL